MKWEVAEREYARAGSAHKGAWREQEDGTALTPIFEFVKIRVFDGQDGVMLQLLLVVANS